MVGDARLNREPATSNQRRLHPVLVLFPGDPHHLHDVLATTLLSSCVLLLVVCLLELLQLYETGCGRGVYCRMCKRGNRSASFVVLLAETYCCSRNGITDHKSWHGCLVHWASHHGTTSKRRITSQILVAIIALQQCCSAAIGCSVRHSYIRQHTGLWIHI